MNYESLERENKVVRIQLGMKLLVKKIILESLFFRENKGLDIIYKSLTFTLFSNTLENF